VPAGRVRGTQKTFIATSPPGRLPLILLDLFFRREILRRFTIDRLLFDRSSHADSLGTDQQLAIVNCLVLLKNKPSG